MNTEMNDKYNEQISKAQQHVVRKDGESVYSLWKREIPYFSRDVLEWTLVEKSNHDTYYFAEKWRLLVKEYLDDLITEEILLGDKIPSTNSDTATLVNMENN